MGKFRWRNFELGLGFFDRIVNVYYLKGNTNWIQDITALTAILKLHASTGYLLRNTYKELMYKCCQLEFLSNGHNNSIAEYRNILLVTQYVQKYHKENASVFVCSDKPSVLYNRPCLNGEISVVIWHDGEVQLFY